MSQSQKENQDVLSTSSFSSSSSASRVRRKSESSISRSVLDESVSMSGIEYASAVDEVGFAPLPADESPFFNDEVSPPAAVLGSVQTSSAGKPGMSVTGSVPTLARFHTYPYASSQQIFQTPFMKVPLILRVGNPPAKDFFNTLLVDDSLVLDIFALLPKNFLCRCARVCKRWHKLSCDETLWKRLDLTGKTLRLSVVMKLIDRGLKVFRLARTHIISDPLAVPKFSSSQNSRTPLADRPPTSAKLKYLDMTMIDATPDAINAILQRCVDLRALSLEYCQINDETLLQISHNPWLEVFNLCMTKGIRADPLRRLLKRCSNLVELNLAWTRLPHEALRTVCVEVSTKIRRLNLAGCREENTINDEDVDALTSRCTRLTELDLSDASGITERSIGFFTERLPILQTLSISRCYGIDAMSYISLTNLLELNMFDSLTDHGLKILGEQLPKKVNVNANEFSTIARPTVGIRRTSIWEQATRDD